MQTALDRAMGKTRAFAESIRNKAASPLPPAVYGGGESSSASSFSGSSGGRERQQLQEFKNWTYVCVNAIAKRCAQQAIIAGQTAATTQTQAGKRGQPGGKKVYEDIEIQPDNECVKAMERPNPIQSRWDFVYTLVCNLLLTGRAYFVGGEVDGRSDDESGLEPVTVNGQRLELWAVPTHWIEPIHQDGFFSGWMLKPDGAAEPTPLEKNAVQMISFGDPADPKRSVSPAATQGFAIRIDESIQRSQAAGFDNGVFPKVAISVGQNVGPDGTTMVRPTLNGAQRRQLVATVKKLWGGVDRAGEPAILDGLIERIDRLSMSPEEMDWERSGKQVKERIFQAFGVHPFMVGEMAPSSYAQADIVSRSFCDNTVNPILDKISAHLTLFFQMVLEDHSFYLWLEPAEPINPELRWTRMMQARSNGDVTRNELRAELGLPEVEETQDRAEMFKLVGGLSGVMELFGAIARGEMAPAAAALTISKFFQIDESEADEWVNAGLDEMLEAALAREEQAAALEAARQPPRLPGPPDEGKRVKGMSASRRQNLKLLAGVKAAKAEQEVATRLGGFFARSYSPSAKS